MKTDLFRKCITKRLEIADYIWVILIFGAISVYGAFRGIPVEDIVINAGHVGPMIAGIIGGPFTGAIAGLAGGIYIFETGGSTSIVFALGTIAAGIITGYFTYYWKGNLTYSKAALMVLIAELVNFVIIPFIFYKDPAYIADLIRISFLPMLIANMTGVLIFIYFLKEAGHRITYKNDSRKNQEPEISTKMTVSEEIPYNKSEEEK
jgi:two-component system sensor histidine kinase LytS